MKVHANARLTPQGRALLVEHIEVEGRPVREAAEAAGVSERTARKWLARHRREGPVGMPTRTAPARERAILALRATRMTAADIAECLRVPARTLSRVLARGGVGRLRRSEPPTRAPVRIVIARTGQQVHIDVEKLGCVPPGGGWRVHGRIERPNRKRGQRYE